MSRARNVFVDGPQDSGEPPKPVASWYTPGFSDGLGDRLLMSDNSSAVSLELLRFHRRFGDRPAFERALRARVDELQDFQHTAIGTVRAVEWLGTGDGLALVSNHTPGHRLSAALSQAHGATFAMELVRQVTPAVAALQRHADGIAHGALTAERIIVTPEGGLVVVEHVLASALESLELPVRWLQGQLGIAVPGNQVVLDPRNDVIQIGLLALSMLLGRRIDPAEYPSRSAELLDEFAWDDRAAAGAAPLRGWIERALQIGAGGFESADEAHDALAELPKLEAKSSGRRRERWAEVARLAPALPAPIEPAQAVPLTAQPSQPSQSTVPTVESFIESWSVDTREKGIDAAEQTAVLESAAIQPPIAKVAVEPPRREPPPAAVAPPPAPAVEPPRWDAPTVVEPPQRESTPQRARAPEGAPTAPMEAVTEPVVARVDPPPVEPPVAAAPPIPTPPPAPPPPPAPAEQKYVLYAVRPPSRFQPPAKPPAPVARATPAPDINSPSVVSRPLVAPAAPVAPAVVPPAAPSADTTFAPEAAPRYMVETLRPVYRPTDAFPSVRVQPGADLMGREMAPAVDRPMWSGPGMAMTPPEPTQSMSTPARWAVAALIGCAIGQGVFIVGILTGNISIGWPLFGRTASGLNTVPVSAVTRTDTSAAPPAVERQPAPRGSRTSTSARTTAAAAAVAPGRLEVTSDPPGARVLVDGRARGVTPLRLAMAAGAHTVVINNGVTSTRRTVNVAAGSVATVVASFAPASAPTGWVTLSTPIELQVYEGVNLLGNTGLPRLALPAGRHTLDVVNAALGFATQVNVDVPAGKTASVPVRVPAGSISINALPWANVWLDGRPLGATPVANVAASLGAHEVVWRHPQFGERRQTVVVTARTPLRLMIDLSK